jgi:diguanylate cyclase (GGDEF)-like protein
LAPFEHTVFQLYPLALGACSIVVAALTLRVVSLRLHPRPGPLVLVASRGVVPMVVALSALVLWLGAYAGELVAHDPATSERLHRVAYVGIVLLPVSVLAVALSTALTSARAHALACALFGIVPAISLALLVAGPSSAWFWSANGIERVGSISFVRFVAGPWFWVHTASSYLSLILAFGLLVRRYVEAGRARAGEAAWLGFAFVLPWLVNAVFVFRPAPSHALDPTPASFTLTTAILLLLLSRPGLARFLPVARGQVFDVLEDPVLVVDERGTILTANAAGDALLARCAPPGAQPAATLAELSLPLSVRLRDRAVRQCAADLALDGALAHFELHVSRVAFSSVVPLRTLVLRNVTDRKRMQRDLRMRAQVDPLTGLSNRGRFAERLEECLLKARESNGRAALILVDLDHFKRVNDSGGHAAGDAILREVAACLRSVVDAHAPGADVGRLGGDEFGIVLPEIGAVEDAGAIARIVVERLREAARPAAGGEPVSASLGVAVFPDDAREPEDLLRCADLAQYLAKRRGRGQFRYFHPQLDRAARRRAAIHRDLATALGAGDLHLVYQPKFRLDDHRLAGFEALARWVHPEIGAVSPVEFVTAAEEIGLHDALASWAVESVCRQVKAWRARGTEPPRIAVNISPKQFASSEFVVRLGRILQREAVTPDALELEVTERTLLHDDESSYVALRDLRAIGCRLALDDFGAASTSLPCLSRYQLDTLKLDAALVQGIADDRRIAAVVGSLVGLAHALDMSVVAEGVEDADCAEALRALGCDEIQGYALSEPLDEDLAGRMIDIQNRATARAAEGAPAIA